MRKAHLFNQENKMMLINQQLYKRRKIAFKKLRIQQLQQQQQPINININTGFEANRRIKEIYKRLELLTPQERTPEPTGPMGETMEEMADIERMNERMERMRADDEAQELLDLAEEERLNDIAIAQEEKEMKIEQDEERNIKFEKEQLKLIKDFKKKEKEKAKQLTPKDLRLNAALKRQEIFVKEQRERINSLFM